MPNGLPEDICRTIFREIQNQTLSHSDRRSTYSIFQNLLGYSNKGKKKILFLFIKLKNFQNLKPSSFTENWPVIQWFKHKFVSAVEQMGGDFVIGFIQQMDAEKDPRNLLLCFNIAHYVSSRMPLGTSFSSFCFLVSNFVTLHPCTH